MAVAATHLSLACLTKSSQSATPGAEEGGREGGGGATHAVGDGGTARDANGREVRGAVINTNVE